LKTEIVGNVTVLKSFFIRSSILSLRII
jgi:hypothetical protein